MIDNIYIEAAAPPPPGVQSNFDSPPNRATLAYAAVITSLIAVTLFAWTRLFVKICIIRRLHAEDYLIPIAWLAAMGQVTCGLLVNDFAPIVHSWDLTWHNFGRYLLLLRLGAVFYNISIVLMKVSVLIQILRIFVPHGSSSKTYWVAHGLMWSNMVYYTIAIFLFIFTCDPVAKAWKPWLPGKCKQMGGISISMAAANLAGDFLTLFLTQKAIWDLMRVREKQRLKLSVLFFAGIIPCGFAIVCLVYSSKTVHTKDFAYDSSLMWAACYGEIASGMFVLLLPVLPRFFMHLRDARFASFLTGSRGVSEIQSSNVGPASGKTVTKSGQRKNSLWHVSYTERNSEEDMIIMSPKKEDFGDKATTPRREHFEEDRSESGSNASTVSISPYDEVNMMEIGRAVTKDIR
ncbi:hypothetical protein K458DRAFT_48075 [Lentithecium fluviatile CBS 122367]|uniref:Rhodopsin domain-containing protein n=1 Tax=Lentithecium fluviatile CBS 122367 TaxID=1168545 RepID=A0A6G1IYF0_9PLEO|nr:hypothetical protein K458DRAFT_48075 [Lentithecium fluviatile CBS 122367]